MATAVPIRLEGVQEDVEELVRTLGYESGGAARRSPQLVLIGADTAGDALLDRIRLLRSEHPEIPILILGGAVAPSICIRAAQCGATDWVETPADAQRVGSALRDNLLRQRLRSEGFGLVKTLERRGEHVAASRNELNRRVHELAQELADKNEALRDAHSQLHARVSQLGMLYRIGRDLSFERNWDSALSSLLERLAVFLEANGLALLLYSRNGTRLAPRSAHGLDPTRLVHACELLLGRAQTLEAEATIFALDALDDEGAIASCAKRDAAWSETILPLRHRDQPLGHVLLMKRYENRAQFEHDRFFLITVQSILAEEVASAQAVNELRAVQRFHRRILDHVDNAVLSLDGDGIIRFANQKARELLGRDEEGYPPGSLLLVGAERMKLSEWIAELEPGTHRVSEGWICSTDIPEGVPVSLWASLLPSEVPGDQPVLVLAEDLRQRRALEAERRRAARQNELLIMAAEWAHDVRTPLTGILHNAELLADSVELSGGQRRHFDVIQGEVTRINELVSNFLDFARPARLKLSPTDVPRLVGEVAALLEGAARERGGRIEWSPRARALGSPLLDRDQLKQALLNLLTNALDASPPGRPVRLRLSKLSSVPEEIAVHSAHGALSLEIVDEGPGVPPENQDRLFIPFFTTKPTGSGLGLAICDKIARAHQGYLRYERRGKTTVFQLVLPILTREGAGMNRVSQDEARG
jgi:signal transduction histidine kinase/ActR/RegA family two-component response regulator